ncbi:MAG: TetR/AcrR family transcriptional regulator [Bacteroidota bacterium]|nr:TetR/AcrR family transcriptional regulator [Bacteroidota bacterium]
MAPTDFDVRERIVTHAREKFLQIGFSKVTLDEIASDLGMSKKTLYKYFSSKEDLFRAGIHQTMNWVASSIEEILRQNKPFAEKIAQMTMTVGNVVMKITRSGQIDAMRSLPHVWKEVEEFRREQIYQKFGRLIRQGREENVFRKDINDEVLLMMLLNSAQGIVQPDVLAQHSFSAQEAMRSIFKIIFEGALTEDARKNFHAFDNFNN